MELIILPMLQIRYLITKYHDLIQTLTSRPSPIIRIDQVLVMLKHGRRTRNVRNNLGEIPEMHKRGSHSLWIMRGVSLESEAGVDQGVVPTPLFERPAAVCD